MLYPARLVWQTVDNMLHRNDPLHDPFNYLQSVCRDILRSRRGVTEKRRDLLQNLIDARIASDDVGKNMTADMQESRDHENGVENSKSGVSFNKSDKLTDDEIMSNAFLFMEAGYETTSTTLAYITHCLVDRPDVQDKVRAEAQSLMERDGCLDYNTLTELPYLDAVVHEVLRLYPPVSYFVTRMASVDYTFNNMVSANSWLRAINTMSTTDDPEGDSGGRSDSAATS